MITAWREFNSCPHVRNVIIKWKGSSEVLEYDDIANKMESQFEPLPEATDEDAQGGSGPSKTDAEIMTDMIDANGKAIAKMSDKLEEVSVKLVHIESMVRRLADGMNEDSPVTPTTGKATGKRKAK